MRSRYLHGSRLGTYVAPSFPLLKCSYHFTHPNAAILYLAEKLCVPVGGILTHPYNNAGSNGTTNGTTMGTSVPFTGEGNHLTNGFAGAVVAAGALAVGILML